MEGVTDDAGRPKRPSLARVNPWAKRAGRRWTTAGAGAGTESLPAGIVVVCGRNRVAWAGWRPDVPGEVMVAGPGNGVMDSGSINWRHRPVTSDFVVGCDRHGSHSLDLVRVAHKLQQLRPGGPRNWPHVRVLDVEVVRT